VAPATAVALAAVAYALGTFPTASLVGRAHGRDVLREGSGNPGASNVYRLAGRRAGLLVFAGDALKGVAAAGLGRVVVGSDGALVAGAAVVVGHCFPATRGLRGGRGVATAAGVVVVVEPVMALAGLLVWAVVAAATRTASAASLVIALGAPVAVALVRGPGREAAVLGAIAALIVARHAGNLARLARGEERSLR